MEGVFNVSVDYDYFLSAVFGSASLADLWTREEGRRMGEEGEGKVEEEGEWKVEERREFERKKKQRERGKEKKRREGGGETE